MGSHCRDNRIRPSTAMTPCKCGCGQPIPPGRKSYAGPLCHGRWRHKHHNHREARQMLFEREGGVCSTCGKDTACLRAGYIQSLLGQFPGEMPLLMDELHPECRPTGFPSLRNSWWQADHKTPIIEGGHSGEDNYRTLCVPCHKKDTRSLQCRRAEKRKAGATMEMDL